MEKIISKIIKSLLVLLIIISQFTLPINVLADELEQTNENQEEVIEELDQFNEEQDETNDESAILDEEQDENSEEQESSDAELESTEEEINNYKITINEEELTEDNFNIDNLLLKNIKIIQEYTGEDTYTYSPAQLMEIDYSNRLYGEYLYELSVSLGEEILETKNITINHIGNNNELINTMNVSISAKKGLLRVKNKKENT